MISRFTLFIISKRHKYIVTTLTSIPTTNYSHTSTKQYGHVTMSSDVMSRFDSFENVEYHQEQHHPVDQKGGCDRNQDVWGSNRGFGFQLHPPWHQRRIWMPHFPCRGKVYRLLGKKTPAKDRGPIAQSSIFLATHEPCMMCISSIVWGSWNKCLYFFGYEATSAQGCVV